MKQKSRIKLIPGLIAISIIIGIILFMSKKDDDENIMKKINNTPLEFTKKRLENLNITKINSIKIIWSGKNKVTWKKISSQERISLYASAITKSYRHTKADKNHTIQIALPLILELNIDEVNNKIFLGYGYDGQFYCNAQTFGNNSFESKDLYNLIKEDLKNLNIKIDI